MNDNELFISCKLALFKAIFKNKIQCNDYKKNNVLKGRSICNNCWRMNVS